MIKIESGVRKLNDGTYVYAYWKDEEYYVVTFVVPEGLSPEIGDFVEGGVLIKREGIQVTNDGDRRWPGTEYVPNDWEEPSYAHDGWFKSPGKE